MSEAALQPDELARAIACVRAHERAAPLGAFAYDAIAAQAEGHALFAGQKFMAQRAAAHGIDVAGAVTELGNLLQVLERGPSEPSELALVSAFAAQGASVALLAADGGNGDRERLARKLVSELEWLETATRYRVWICLHALLQPDARSAVDSALEHALTSEDRADIAKLPDAAAVRARSAARLSMLATGDAPSSRAALERLRAVLREPALRASCAALLGEALPPTAAPLRLTGRTASITRKPFLAALRWLTGFALLHAALRAIGFLLRFERELEVQLDGSALRTQRRTLLFGRTIRKSDAVFPLMRIRGVRRYGRYALLRTVIGMLSLSFGVLIGGYFGFDAARGGASALLSASAVLCALGTGLDLAFDVLGSSVRGDVRLQIDLDGVRTLALSGVPSADADRFLDRLGERFAAGTK